MSRPEVRGVVGEARSSVLIATVALSMAVTPNLAEAGRALAGRMRRRAQKESDIELVPRTVTAPVLIVGMGRVGRALANALIEFGIDYHAIERDHLRLRQAIADGYEASFGDANDTRLWQSINMHDRKFIVFTAPDIDVVSQTAYAARTNFPYLRRFAVVTDKERGRLFEGLGMTAIFDGDGDPLGTDVARVILSELGIPTQVIDDWIERQVERMHEEITLKAA
jgi:CPA2 family monovalent cation:H+ antiporter-2